MMVYVLEYIVSKGRYQIVVREYTLAKAKEMVEKHFFTQEEKTFVKVVTSFEDTCQKIMISFGPLVDQS